MSGHGRTSVVVGFLTVALAVSAVPAVASPGTVSGAADAAAAVPVEPGRVRWRVRLGGDYSFHSPGVGADGTVYVGMSDGRLYAVAPSGTIRWVFQAGLGGGVYGPVSVGLDGTIYVAGIVAGGPGATGAILAINPNGTLRWSFDAGAFMIGGPNVGPDGNVYAVTDLGGIGLFSLTPAGQLRFSTGVFSEKGPLGQEIVFANDRLYFAFDMSSVGPPRLFGYDLNGGLRFEAPNPANGAQPATGPNGNVVVPAFPVGVGLSLAAFNANGTFLWRFYEFPGNVQTAADIGPDNTAYSSRNLATLLALDANGAVRWRYVDPGILFEPAVTPTGSLVFVPGRVTYGQPGFFLGVSPSGQPRWRVDLPDEPGLEPYGQLVPTSRPVFSPDGTTAYTVTDVAGDGAVDDPFAYLYAIDVTTGGGSPPPPPPPPPGIPTAPSGLTATAASSQRVQLAWRDNATNESGVRIERCTGRDCTSFSVIGQVGANATSYTDSTVAPNSRYRYRVQAWNAAGSSGYSNVAAVRTRR
jgi:outer membrane protein assembly factor BamB